MSKTLGLCLLLLSIGVFQRASADPFSSAARRFHVDPVLLKSIAMQESQGYPWTLNFGGHSLFLTSRDALLKAFNRSRSNHWLVCVHQTHGHKQCRFLKTRSKADAFRDRASRDHTGRVTVVKIDPLNVDIGVMQLNWRWHHKSFTSVAQMASISRNIDYAAHLIARLIKQYGLKKGIGYYHNRASKRRWTQYYRSVTREYASLTR